MPKRHNSKGRAARVDKRSTNQQHIFQDFWDEMRDRGGGVFHADALKDIRKKLDDEESLISGKALNHAHGLPAWPASQFRTSDSVIHLGDRY